MIGKLITASAISAIALSFCPAEADSNLEIDVIECMNHAGILKSGSILCYNDNIQSDSLEVIKNHWPFDTILFSSPGGNIEHAYKISEFLNSKEIQIILFDNCISACASVIFSRSNNVILHDSLIVIVHGVRGLNEFDIEKYFGQCMSGKNEWVSEFMIKRLSESYLRNKKYIFPDTQKNTQHIQQIADEEMLKHGIFETCSLFNHYYIMPTTDVCSLRKCDAQFIAVNSKRVELFSRSVEQFACRVAGNVFFIPDGAALQCETAPGP